MCLLFVCVFVVSLCVCLLFACCLLLFVRSVIFVNCFDILDASKILNDEPQRRDSTAASRASSLTREGNYLFVSLGCLFLFIVACLIVYIGCVIS